MANAPPATAANEPPAVGTTATRYSIGGSNGISITQWQSFRSGIFGFDNMTSLAILYDISMILKISLLEKSISPTARKLSLWIYSIKLIVETLSFAYVIYHSKKKNQSTVQPGTVILFVNWVILLLTISVLSTSIYIDYKTPFHNDVWNIIFRVLSVIGYIFQIFYILYVITNLSKSTDELQTRRGTFAKGHNKKKLQSSSSRKSSTGAAELVELSARGLNGNNLQPVALNDSSAGKNST